MTRHLPIEQSKSCGSCTACCEALQVKSLDKGDWQRCKHLRRGSIKGCGIYKDRPKDCAEYACFWLAGVLEEADLRPDRCGFILSMSEFCIEETETGTKVMDMYIMVHELRPGALTNPRAKAILDSFATEVLVIEITRDGMRKVRGGPSEAVQRMVDIARELEAKGVPGYRLEKNP